MTTTMLMMMMIMIVIIEIQCSQDGRDVAVALLRCNAVSLAGRYQRFGEIYCLQPWRWRRYVRLELRHLPASPHGAASPKTNIDIATVTATQSTLLLLSSKITEAFQTVTVLIRAFLFLRQTTVGRRWYIPEFRSNNIKHNSIITMTFVTDLKDLHSLYSEILPENGTLSHKAEDINFSAVLCSLLFN